MDVQGILAVRAFDRFHGDGLATFLTHIPDSGIDFASFKVFSQDRLLSQQAARKVASSAAQGRSVNELILGNLS